MTDPFSQSWQRQDIYGNPVQIDADENGEADDPAVFDAAWKAGVFREIQAFRALMPHALVNGHSMDIYEPGIAGLFNGLSLGFATANVLEGEESFGAVWNRYHEWFRSAVRPVEMMVESSPLDLIAYGYDYSPIEKIPPATLEFARSFYPWMRFGLVFTLMNDGYFAHEYGDTWHGNDWWYDELDFSLGQPLGPAQRIVFSDPTATNLIVNPGFETAIVNPWRFSAHSGAAGHLMREPTGSPAGNACARVNVTTVTGTDWHVEFAQYSRSLTQGVAYDFEFLARSSAPRFLTVSAQKSSPDWRGYGLWQRVWLTNGWQAFSLPFTATETVGDARLQFFLGGTNGTVWVDEVRLVPHPPDVYRRDFTHGVALLNGTREARDIPLEAGLRRLNGTQAPRLERILDDRDAGFSTTGAWVSTNYDSGEWQASGPFYHSWAGGLRESRDAGAEARWQLPVEAADTYTLDVWWPAAPAATNWSRQVRFEVVTDAGVIASTNLDQTLAGDQWHRVATVTLSPTDHARLRLIATNTPCVADAVWIRSTARYNDGQPATHVRLPPMDGIILQRDQPRPIRPKINRLDRSQDAVRISVSDLTPGVTNELQRACNLSSPDWLPAARFISAESGTNLWDTPPPDQPAVFYRVRCE